MRRKFENWYQEEVSGCNGEWLEKGDDGEYYERITRDAWVAWQEATKQAYEECAKLIEASQPPETTPWDCAEIIRKRSNA